MISAAVAVLISFVVTLLATPLVRALALRNGVVDKPGGRRVHENVTPRLGGVAVMAGFFAPLALFALVQTAAMRLFLGQSDLVVGLLLGSAVVGLVGAADDARGLGPWKKLAAQAIAAVIAYSYGYRIDAINVPLFGDFDMGVLALPVTVFWFLAITNAINLIDGLDGLASGIAFFAAGANFAIAYLGGSPPAVLLLSASLGGALLGFLRYNFNPASIFLGDSGSMFLGFVLAATSLVGHTTKSSTAVAILAPVIALGVPIFDTMLAMVRRALARQSIFAADRGHIHHRLLDIGLTHRRVVLMLYALSTVLALAAVAVAFGRSWQVGGAILLVGGTLFVVLRVIGIETFLPRRAPNREALLAILQERSEHSISALKEATDAAQIRHSLARFAVPGLSLDTRLSSTGLPSARGRRTFAYEISVGPQRHILELTVEPNASALTDADVEAALRPLVDACRAALNRMKGQAVDNPATASLAAVAHAVGAED